jgi:hypothetical protein
MFEKFKKRKYISLKDKINKVFNDECRCYYPETAGDARKIIPECLVCRKKQYDGAYLEDALEDILKTLKKTARHWEIRDK